MIISPGRNYIFVHIPKTGGTALATALEARAMKDDILIGDTPKARRRRKRLGPLRDAAAGRVWKHATLADIEGMVPGEVIEGAMIVTLVRNPWDRMVSYYHWLRDQEFDHPAVRLARAVGFSEFLHDQGVQASISAHPYGRYVAGRDGRECAARFIRLEHFAEDAAEFEAHLGFALTLPRVNVSTRDRDHRGYFGASERAIVGRICAEDIARFGYEFCPEG